MIYRYSTRWRSCLALTAGTALLTGTLPPLTAQSAAVPSLAILAASSQHKSLSAFTPQTSVPAGHFTSATNAPSASGQAASTQAAIAQLKQRGLYSSLSEAMQQAVYAIERAPNGSFTADNAAQRYTTRFAPGGVAIQPIAPNSNARPSLFGKNATAHTRLAPCVLSPAAAPDVAATPALVKSSSAAVTLALRSIGYGSEQTVVAPILPQQAGKRVEYQHPNVTEWYENKPQGLEQGFTLAKRPAQTTTKNNANTPLCLNIEVSSRTAPRLSADKQSVLLAGGLAYKNLVVKDSRGSRVPAHLSVHRHNIALNVQDRNAQYPLVIDPTVGTATPLILAAGSRLAGTDTVGGDNFGRAVAINGDTVVAGASAKNNNAGAAYVFVRNGTIWMQQQKLTASDAAGGDNFGGSIAISGDSIVVGAFAKNNNTGAAYVFVRSAGQWTQQRKLTATDANSNDQFGYSVAINGDTVVTGAYQKNGTGAAYVFVRGGTTWAQQAELTASDAASSDNFGFSIGISGDTVAVGAYGKNNGMGAGYIFARNAGQWTQQQELTASDAAGGDFFGYSVSVSGDTVVVGAYGKNNGMGAAYVFVRNGTIWTQQQELTASDAIGGDYFGGAVGISGDTVVAGAPGKSYAYVFARSGTTWTQQTELTAIGAAGVASFGRSVGIDQDTFVVGASDQNNSGGGAYVSRYGPKLTADDAVGGDYFGYSVSVSGDTAVVGALLKSSQRGAAYVFVRNGTAWMQQAELTASDAIGGDFFGGAVGISGDTIVVGAYKKSNQKGAAYVFVRSMGQWTQQQQLIASDASSNDQFGYSVAISSDTVAVGAYQKNGTGAAYVFVRSMGQWTQQAELTAGDAASGDAFGYSVGVSGDTVVVGAIFKNSQRGAAYVFVRSMGQWAQQQKLTASDTAISDYFGGAVGISGDTVAVGAYQKNSSAGAAYVFVRNGTTWAQQAELTASDAAFGDQFGFSIGISGDMVAVGANNKNTQTGAGYVFARSGAIWMQQQKLTAGDGAGRDQFGAAVGISGDTVVVGAFAKNSAAGAAYVYGRSPIGKADTYTLPSGMPFSVSAANGVLANDNDPEGLTFTALPFRAPAHGMAVLNADGSFTYTPNNGFSGMDTFLYLVRNSIGGISDPTLVTLTVPQTLQNVTASVGIVRSGYTRLPASTTFTQRLTLTNKGQETLTGPISLVLDNLPSNITLSNKDGDTSANAPVGSAYINAPGSLAPGASVVLTLRFSDPANVNITYTTRVLAGPGTR